MAATQIAREIADQFWLDASSKHELANTISAAMAEVAARCARIADVAADTHRANRHHDIANAIEAVAGEIRATLARSN